MKDIATKFRNLLAKTSPGRWISMREGNQYLKGELVGASRIDGIGRPWSPYYVISADKLEEVARFTDEDADFIATIHNELPAILDEIERLRVLNESMAHTLEVMRHPGPREIALETALRDLLDWSAEYLRTGKAPTYDQPFASARVLGKSK